MKKPIIIKLGGSLLHQENGEILKNLGKRISENTNEHSQLKIIPGGGIFADGVRQAGEKYSLQEETCHYMALLAMDQYGYLLQEFIPHSQITTLACDLQQVNNQPHPQILLCSEFISSLSPTDLPRTWDITSDSIAGYLAKERQARLLILIKSIDINVDLKEPDIDPFFQKLMPFSFPTWIINGLFPARLSQLLATGVTQGIFLPAGETTARLIRP